MNIYYYLVIVRFLGATDGYNREERILHRKITLFYQGKMRLSHLQNSIVKFML